MAKWQMAKVGSPSLPGFFVLSIIASPTRREAAVSSINPALINGKILAARYGIARGLSVSRLTVKSWMTRASVRQSYVPNPSMGVPRSDSMQTQRHRPS